MARCVSFQLANSPPNGKLGTYPTPATRRNASGKYVIRSRAVRDTWPRSSAPKSPASPGICTPSWAASKASIPWQTRAVITPVSTSPDPPVAIPGLPVAFLVIRRPSVGAEPGTDRGQPEEGIHIIHTALGRYFEDLLPFAYGEAGAAQILQHLRREVMGRLTFGVERKRLVRNCRSVRRRRAFRRTARRVTTRHWQGGGPPTIKSAFRDSDVLHWLIGGSTLWGVGSR